MADITTELEDSIKEETLRYLKEGRTGWDTRHTLSSVKWMKELIAKEGGDSKILLPAIYFHDTGYDTLPEDYDYEDSRAAKPGHAENSALLAKKFLQATRQYSANEIAEVVRLIENHDIHDNVARDDHNRQLTLEADGLGSIDWYNCKPSFDKDNAVKWFREYFNKQRIPNFRTKTGISIMNVLLKKCDKYLKDWS